MGQSHGYPGLTILIIYVHRYLRQLYGETSLETFSYIREYRAYTYVEILTYVQLFNFLLKLNRRLTEILRIG